MTDPMADLERQLKPYRDQVPSFRQLPAHGIAAPEIVAALAADRGAGCHVDACLGGFHPAVGAAAGLPGTALRLPAARRDLDVGRHAGRLYDELFGEFTGFYRRNRKAYARLNRTRVREGAWS